MIMMLIIGIVQIKTGLTKVPFLLRVFLPVLQVFPRPLCLRSDLWSRLDLQQTRNLAERISEPLLWAA